MSAQRPELTTLVYEYLNRSTDPVVSATSDDRSSWVHSSVYVDEYGNGLVDRLLAAESYPGEAFEAVLRPSPEAVAPAFVDDVGVQSHDIVGFAAPSSQLYDDLFYALYAAMSEAGAVLTTKYPLHAVRSRFPSIDPFVIDSTPGAETDGGVDAEATDSQHVRCGDLTSLGVAAERATTQLAAADQPGTFAIATMTQLLAHHDSAALDRFLHELVGQWRNQGVGGIVHLPPKRDVDGSDWFGSAHFDYVIELRSINHGIEARVCGKRDVAPTWQVVGSAPRPDGETPVQLLDQDLSGADDPDGDAFTAG